MNSKILAPRRILIAVAITAILGSASVIAVGAGEGEPLGEVPATWGVAEPRIGDRGTYTYAQIDPATGGPIGPEVVYYAFEQSPASEELDASGLPKLVNTLRVAQAAYLDVDDPDRDPDPLVWGLDEPRATSRATDGTIPFFDLIDIKVSEVGEGTFVAGVPVTNGQGSTDASLLMRIFPDHEIAALVVAALDEGASLCGVRNPLQGRELALDGRLPFLAHCDLVLGGVDPNRLRLLPGDADEVREGRAFAGVDGEASAFPLGLQRLGDLETLVLEVDGGAADGLRLWMARNVPYPVQYALERDGFLHVLRLTLFERGVEPLAAGPALDRPAAPPLEMGGVLPWGLDDTASTLLVPPSQAWQAALDDGPLATFLREHPEAFTFLSTGSGAQDPTYGTERFEWEFQVTDGIDAMAVIVEATVEPLVPIPPRLGLPVQSPMNDPSYSFTYGDPETFPPINRSWLPPQVPTGPSLVTHWRAFSAVDHPYALWGHVVACQGGVGFSIPLAGLAPPDYEDCVAPYDFVPYVGLQATSIEPDLTSNPGQPALVLDVAMHGAWFEQDGAMTLQADQRISHTERYAATPLAPATTQTPYTPPPALSGDWQFPGVATVASLGFLAAAAGALYLLWPVLKGGVVGLFSRVTGQELLEHPQRQKLLMCIEAQPGIHLKELARQTGLAWGQTQHHMAKLVSSGAVVAKPSAGYTCYFPKGQDRHVMASAAVLKADGARRLLNAIATTTGLSVGQLSRSVGLTESTAHYHLKRLEGAGLVTTHLIDGARRVTLTALGSEAGRRFGGVGAASVAA